MGDIPTIENTMHEKLITPKKNIVITYVFLYWYQLIFKSFIVFKISFQTPYQSSNGQTFCGLLIFCWGYIN